MHVAEVNLHAEFLLEPLVLKKENVVVEGDTLHLWIPLLHPQERSFNVAYRDRENPLQERHAHVPISEPEEHTFTALPRDDEVSLHVPQSLSVVDTLGSFANRSLSLDPRPSPSSSSFLAKDTLSVCLNTSPVRTLDEPTDDHRGSVGEGWLPPSQSLPNLLGRLIVEEMLFNEGAETLVESNLLSYGTV